MLMWRGFLLSVLHPLVLVFVSKQLWPATKHSELALYAARCRNTQVLPNPKRSLGYLWRSGVASPLGLPVNFVLTMYYGLTITELHYWN